MSSHGETRTDTDNSLSSRAIDQESRRVIREDLLTNILVEAGAGSGKTQMLAERMAAGVASGVYQVEHMAAVTFTRKAASELRGRFHLALEQRLTKDSADSRLRLPEQASRTQAEEEARVRVALGNLERFFAGTIHSFCARLLRERPVESGVSPGFTELDEVQDEEVRNRAWRDFIAAARSAGDPEMLALLDTGVRPNDLDSAFHTICNNEDVEFPPGDGVCPDPKAAWKALEQFWTKLAKLLPDIIGEDTTCGIQKAARQYRAQLRVTAKRLDRPSTIASLMETWKCDSKITQKAWATSSTEKKRYKDLVETMHADFRAATVDPFLNAWRQYVYRLSVSLLTRAREYAARERRLRNALNYGDLLNLAARVLRENPQVRRALQRKYQNLFVDEFQDTDPVQAEIVFLLAADERGSLGEQLQPGTGQRSADVLEAGSWKLAARWRQVSLRPGALFVVGDPKQSIYRFRRADIEIYNTVRERFSDPATGRVVPLTMNFRSVPALCDWANTVFVDQFPKEPTPHSPRFQALDSKDDPSEPSSGGVFTITHTCDSRDVPAEDAAKIARYIKAEVDAGRRKYSDFLILTRKKKGRIAPYASALEELNIPVEVSGAGAFGESAEVETLTTLLRALSDPQDALPLVAVLRGPLFGFSDPELFAFKQGGGWFSIFHGHDSSGTPVAQGFSTAEASAKVVSPAGSNGTPVAQRLSTAEASAKAVCSAPGRVADALATLRQYYRWTRILPAGAALDRILEHTGYLALAATTPGGVEAGDLLHALDRVRQVAEDGGSLGDAADALAADSEASNEVESLPLEPGRTDVVRLMNLHKAKGLEADVVFLADPCGGPKQWVDVHIERRGQQAVGWFKVAKKSETSYASKLLGEHADWPAHEAAELPYLQAEQSRLLYVAATRARQLLIVSRQMPARGTAAWGVLNNSLAGAKELKLPSTVAATTLKPASSSVKVQTAAHLARSSTQAAVTPPSWSITSVTAEAKHIAKIGDPTEPAAGDGATLGIGRDTASHRADAGMAWGTLIHGLLEHAMRHPAATAHDLRRLAGWLTVEYPELRGVIDQAVATSQTVASASFWGQAQSGEHAVEVPFTAKSEPTRLSTGVVDLLYRALDAPWQVIDYKTDTKINAEALATYQAQLRAYQVALDACGLELAGAALRYVRGSGA